MHALSGQVIGKTQDLQGTTGNANSAALTEIFINYPFGHQLFPPVLLSVL
jgi:hypothetical protein